MEQKQNIKFIHKVSKGSRFNQIYIPSSMEEFFEVGDLVEIRLVNKKIRVYYSKNTKKLGSFKEKLIQNIFSFLIKFREINQIFIIGSFLTKKEDYNDIDIIIVSEKANEKQIYNDLIKKFELKFHIIILPRDKLNHLLKICPLTRSMFYYFISNMPFEINNGDKLNKSEIDKKHIKFLLMMPEDLLKINLNSRVFYDAIRRLITINRFLENKELNPLEIEAELKELMGDSLFNYIKNNEALEDKIVEKLRNIIKNKLDKINKILKYK
ncbi:hypothetical protein J4466_03290 [Candidatus Pacearchaeota archaeon]|nr:hypothetical protein [Candidatus Pacearchaeota archaeon]